MQDSFQRPTGPWWHRHLHPDGYAYGWLLALTLISLGFQMGAPDTEWARLTTIVLQSATLVGALLVSGSTRWLLGGVAVIAAVAVLATLIATIGSSEVGEESGRGVGLLLVLLAPVAIFRGIVRQARSAGRINVRTMFGVLCIYLLLGMAFGFAYGIISAVGDEPFFAQIARGDQADFLYFSFATLTTTGFGDLTAAYDLGRSLAITEALIGQIYLVTVVSLIVGNIAATARRPAQ